MMVFHHVRDLQRLHPDDLVFVDETARELVEVVIALVGDAFMDFGDLETGFISVLGAFLLTREGLLTTFEEALRPGEVL